MLIPRRANGSSTPYSAPGRSRMYTSSECGRGRTAGNALRPMTRKRVVLSLRSSIGPAIFFSA
nr:hypothetical protein [Thermomonas sp.]